MKIRRVKTVKDEFLHVDSRTEDREKGGRMDELMKGRRGRHGGPNTRFSQFCERA